MSDIQERPISDRAKRRSSPHRIHLDMAPMVDLAFLLLTFFMLTTRLIKPTAMELDFPKTGTGGETANILTVLLDDRGRVFAYQGTLEQGGQPMRHLSDKNLRATLLAFNHRGREALEGLLLHCQARKGEADADAVHADLRGYLLRHADRESAFFFPVYVGRPV